MKHNFIGTVILLFFLTAFSLASRAQNPYVLSESFEGGIPVTWMQENISGVQNWAAEQGGTYPAGAADGNFRVALRNNSSQTQGFVTRLITPPININGFYRPILVFERAQEHRLGDVDELKVYYRNSPQNQWILLKTYAERQRTWKADTLSLPAQSANYQIAFEGKDNFGRGIVLDNIRVRPAPQCITPSVTSLSSSASGSYDVYWTGSFDSDAFRLKASKFPLADAQSSVAEIDTTVEQAFCTLANLEVNTVYYFYVQAFCAGEVSDWSEVFTYKTASTASLPFYENFNLEYNGGFPAQKQNWIWRNIFSASQPNYVSPFINSHISVGEWTRYSADNSTCAVFAENGDVQAPLETGHWAYMASPKILVDNLADYQVSFTGSAYLFVGKNYASSIIIGIMDDAEDFTTFVPVDTVAVRLPAVFEEFIVKFNNYNGNGKYVAFLSNFRDKKNFFTVDNVKIGTAEQCPKITEVRTLSIEPRRASFSFNSNGFSGTYNILVTKNTVTNPSAAPANLIQYQGVVSSNNFTLPANSLGTWSNYYLYIQAQCSGSEADEWSNPIVFKTPCEQTGLPISFTFEEAHDGYYQPTSSTLYKMSNCLYVQTNHRPLGSTVPPNIGSGGYNGGSKLSMIGGAESQAYVAFPTVASLQNVRMLFYAKASTTSGSKIEIGVMSDITDFGSFTPIDTIAATAEWEIYSVNFRHYAGTGKNIAIAVSSENIDMCSVSVDDVLIEEVPDCEYVIGKIYSTPAENSAVLSWDDAGTSYQVKISTTPIQAVNLNTAVPNVLDTIININSLTVNNLQSSTVYYFYLQNVCGTEKTGIWSGENSFQTLCLSRYLLPIVEDFENGNFKPCWGNFGLVFTPKVSNAQGISATGQYALVLPVGAITVLPGIDVSSAGALQISFLARAASSSEFHSAIFNNPLISVSGSEIEVGVLTSPTDFQSFTPLKSISLAPETNYQEITVRLNEYAGAGRYIALHTPQSKIQATLIDNISIDSIGQECNKPYNLKAKEITANSAKLYWDKGGEEREWKIIVLNNKNVNPNNVNTQQIVYQNIVSTNTGILVNNLQPSTTYYYYLKAICSRTDTTAWTAGYGMFRTTCLPISLTDLGIETFESGQTHFDCWETGVVTGITNKPELKSDGGSTRLYIYNSIESDGAYAIMQPLAVSDIADYQVKMTAYSKNSTMPDYNGNYPVTASLNQRKIIVGIITNTADFASFVSLDTVQVELNNPLTYIVRFDKYAGDYNGERGTRIMFLSQFGIETTSNAVYLDNIKVEAIPACAEPYNISVDSVSYNAATIFWNGLAGTYRVKVATAALSADDLEKPKTQNPASVIYDENIAANHTRIAGLTNLSTYYVYVQKICSASEKSAWSDVRTFTTVCPPSYSLPYSQNFNSGNFPPCWNKNGNATYPNINNQALYLVTSGMTGIVAAILPAMETDNVSKLHLWFDAALPNTYYGGKVLVGASKSPVLVNDSTFVIADTVDIKVDYPNVANNQYFRCYVDLSTLKNTPQIADYKYITLATTAALGNGVSIDNLLIEIIPPCRKPENLTLKTANMTSLEVVWTDNYAQNWEIQYGSRGFALGSGTIIPVNQRFAKIENLTENTQYDIYVRAVCGADGSSGWVGVLQAQTLPYVCQQATGIYFDYSPNVTSGTLHWDSNETNTAWTVEILRGNTQIFKADSLTVNQVFVSSLTPNTDLSVRIVSHCNARNINSALLAKSVRTPCVFSPAGTLWTFEASDALDCWNYNTAQYNPSRYNGAYDSYVVSRSDAREYALYFYNTPSSKGNYYATMPGINASMDTLQLHFHVRGGYLTTNQGIISVPYSPANGYAFKLYVGTVTVQNDISTFTVLDSINIQNHVGEIPTAANNWLFQEVIVPLANAKGQFVTFMGSRTQGNYFFIDDVSIEGFGCFAPVNLAIDSVTSLSAKLSWQSNGNHGISTVIRSANDADFTKNAVYDTVNISLNSYKFQNLHAGTRYYVQLQQLCDKNGESAWSQTVNFTTAHSIYLDEKFTELTNQPQGWTRYAGRFEGNEILTSNLILNSATTASNGWVRSADGNPHEKITIHGASTNHWFVSPSIELAADLPEYLTFDLRLATVQGGQITDFSGTDDRFAVLISENGGNTWKSASKTEWNNAGTGNYAYNSISFGGEKMKIDLSAFAGKTVKIAFYAESKTENAISEIHIDNIHINRTVNQQFNSQICSGNDYTKHGFDVLYNNLAEGANVLTRSYLSDNSAVADTAISVNVTVLPFAEKNLSASICAGETYGSNNFNASKQGIYKQKLTATNACDSLVVLNLTVIAAKTTQIFDTTCRNVPYIFNGKFYNRSGEYADTLPSLETGCDSIVTLYLQVRDAYRSEFSVTVCHNQTYVFGGETLTESGDYIDTLQTAIGCDSIVTLHLTVRERLRTLIYDATCAGQNYTGYGFVNMPPTANDYGRGMKTAENCDSTVVLRLAVTNGSTPVSVTLPKDSLPIIFFGTLYPKDTPAGTYSGTANFSCGTVNTTLVISNATAIDNILDNALSVVPTIISRGETVKITAETDCNIEIYDMLGRQIYSQKSVAEITEISVFNTSGIFSVRAVTPSGKELRGRVVVK